MTSARRVWIDTDMGFDDLAAVLTVQHGGGWTVDGLSLVAGNAPLDVVVDNALRAAACFGWRMPIHAGCAQPLACELVTAQYVLGANGMASTGRSLPLERVALADGHSVDALAVYLRNAPAPTVLLALGPLTNLATLLQREPGLASRIGQLVWMGGSAGPGNHTATAEFNAAVDPEAINVVLDALADAGVSLQMVGLDACRQVRVRAADAQDLRESGVEPLARERAALLADLLLGYVHIAGDDPQAAMALYDPTAAAALVAPDAVQFGPAHLVAECQGEHTRGMTVVEWRVPRRVAANALVATQVNEAAVRRIVLGALATAALAAQA